jgi:cell division protein FtsW (lipid II flippase)
MEKPDSLLEDPRRVGVACAIAATGLGLAYMAAAGAPPLYLAVNVLALLMGLAFFGLLRPRAGNAPLLPPAVTLAFGAVLLATALFGSSVEGASRWFRVGGLSLQMSLILLPPMLVAFARRRDVLSTLGLILAAVALAMQPDRAMAGVLASSLAVLAVRRRDNGVLAALGVAAAGCAVTLVRADTLPAVPYVDQILYTAFGVHPLAGLAVVAGALLLAAPALAARKLDARSGDACAVFGIAWLGMVLAAALGNYPTPLVGYGGSAVLGYVLSLAFLPGRAPSTAAVQARSRVEENAGEGTGSDLRIAIA